MIKKTWTKEEFIHAANKQMENICDPKRTAANRCKKGARIYKLRQRKEQMKKRGPRNA